MSVKIMSEGKQRELLTVVEAAAIIECHPNTVSAYARDGRLQGHKMGKVWYFDEGYVREFKERYVIPQHGGKRPNTRKPAEKKTKSSTIKEMNFASGKRRGRVVDENDRPQGKIMRINGKRVLFYNGPSNPDEAWDWGASVGLR